MDNVTKAGRFPSWAWKVVAASLGGAAVLAVLLRAGGSRRKRELRSLAPTSTARVAPATGPPPVLEVSAVPPAASTVPVAAAPTEPKQAPPSAPLSGIEAQRAAMGAGEEVPEDGPIEKRVEQRLRARFSPSYLEVVNQGGSCSAPKLAVLMVSEYFYGKTKLSRQREVQALLTNELDQNYIHAINMALKTPEEYAKVLAKQSGQ
mmetsp:Transcript_49334/g.130787  ORF Transcript_49334/g.130787 Transcript_49334/m.130787 type:complete len:205 (-) Transcript_49334:179-793(-)